MRFLFTDTIDSNIKIIFSSSDCEIFIEGFRMGVRVMLEVMNETDGGR